jgi:hypothetical protein
MIIWTVDVITYSGEQFRLHPIFASFEKARDYAVTLKDEMYKSIWCQATEVDSNLVLILLLDKERDILNKIIESGDSKPATYIKFMNE